MKRVAIVGAGIVGTALAHHLALAGHQVDLFENGPETPYPQVPQYQAEVLYANFSNPPAEHFPPALPPGIKGLTQSGDYQHVINDERTMCVGGQATRWFGITPRIHPESFKPKTLYGFGVDWPLTYSELEAYYGLAETYIGISGSNDDNPFAAYRSKPYPLPEFEISSQDAVLAAQLRDAGIITHTTPQARVRQYYDGRPACQNFGVCETCPVGARYNPAHHLTPDRRSPSITLHTNCLVRRIILEGDTGKGVAYHPQHGDREVEHRADAVILAAGAIETARLLLLSRAGGIHRNGLGNAAGLVGRNLGFHHVWWGELTFEGLMMPGRAGPPTLMSHQFTRPEGKRNYGGATVELFDTFPSRLFDGLGRRENLDRTQIMETLLPGLRKRTLTMNAETIPSDDKYLDLSGPKDRFGDPFASVTYRLNDFDHETYRRVGGVAKQVAGALGAQDVEVFPIEQFWSAHHHLGTCRMGANGRDSVVDSFGAIHGARGLYVCGGSTFPTVTPLQPTLTMVAMAIRTAARVAEELNA